MRTIASIEQFVEQWTFDQAVPLGMAAREPFLEKSEQLLEIWLEAHGRTPTRELKEGFRLLALHRQSAKGDPSFNACRETCREIVYRYNLAATPMLPGEWRANLATLRRLVQHLAYFVGGKMQDAEIGEFCCASRPLRADASGER